MAGHVRGVCLNHADAEDGAGDEDGDDVVGDLVVGLVEGFEGNREGVFVAPAGPAAVEEREVVRGAMVVVVCC